MSEDASYYFLSVLRRGLAALAAPVAPAGDPRLGLTVALATGGSPIAAPPMALRGPGDVAGFDARVIRRMWPSAGALSAESNYFALAELTDPDLPWRYSPDAAAGDRLTPWLCLIVLEDGEIVEQTGPASGRPLASVTVSGPQALPDLDQAWAWAHAQIVGPPQAPASDFDAPGVGAVLAQAPARASSRLLCPRQLKPQRHYTAFVVPTFERGRLAGLGQPTTGVDRLTPAWQPHQDSVSMPVYFSWSFQTGANGDFASLAARLQPLADVPVGAWKRPISLTPPGTAPPTWQVIDLAGALLPLGATTADWPGLDEHGFTAALASLVNAPGIRLAPPLYGRWLAATENLATDPAPSPPWFHQLNADPRARVAAGMGTTVVQGEQQDLLAGAWAQLEGIGAVNRRLRLSQLARELAVRLQRRHLTALDPQSLILVSAPVHGRVRLGASTAAAQLAASPIVPGVLAPGWRRTSRPLGSIGARQLSAASSGSSSAGTLARLNSGALSVVPIPTAPPAGATGAAARLGGLAQVFSRVNVKPETIATVSLPSDFTVKVSVGSAVATTTDRSATHTTITHASAVSTSAMGTSAVATSAVPTGTAPLGGTTVGAGLPIVTGATKATLPKAAGAKFATAAGTLMANLSRTPAVGTIWLKADLDATTAAIHATLDPVATIEAPLAARLTGAEAGSRRTDPLEPVMSAPQFSAAMYAPLADAGREWLLPGLDQMPADVVALFTTNWALVESYLVGLNHEMARKLLWNGFPTDQRSTYFTRFWDVRGAGEGRDVSPITGWTNTLGQNHSSGPDPLVLLVRGELIRRYPNLVVYAAPAVVTDGVRQIGPDETDPIFVAMVGTDLALFGFDVDPTAARGDPGWFFVLQEHPCEPRFGLEVPGDAFGAAPSSWQKLGWDHLASSEADLAGLGYIDLTASLPLDPATPDDAGAVWHANGTPPSRSADVAHISFREPKRLEIHGSVLIPAPAPPDPAGGGQ